MDKITKATAYLDLLLIVLEIILCSMGIRYIMWLME